jgi:hypothetical protein
MNDFVHGASGEVVNLSDIRLDADSQEVVERGKKAWSDKTAGKDWEEWKAIGFALEIGRREVMKLCHINRPEDGGALYSRVYGEWLSREGFSMIDKAARARLMKCIDNLIAIEKWRMTLSLDERVRYNHPSTVLRKFEAAGKDGNKGEPRVNKKDEAIRELQEELDEANRKLADGEFVDAEVERLKRELADWQRRAEQAEAQRDQWRIRAVQAEDHIIALTRRDKPKTRRTDTPARQRAMAKARKRRQSADPAEAEPARSI